MTIRTWLITGANSGFGRHMTEQLLERGDRVAGTVRGMDAMGGLKERYGDRLWLARLDVTDTPAIRAVVAEAFRDLGRIDVVVNNAGYGLFGAAEEFTDDQLLHQIGTNLIGSIQMVRAALPFMRAQGGGRIIQLSSMGGQAAFPGGSLYHATKWGIEGFIEATMLDVAPFGIGLTIVEPGGARTDFRYRSAMLGTKLDAYDASPASQARGIIEEAQQPSLGDPAKMAAVIIASADRHPAPKRIVLGSDAYGAVRRALTERLASLEAQKEQAQSTDVRDRA
ncbi:SDR family oxidoreductase [Paenibacillus sp. MWE-103]|uniref:SDR family oxidoreductase n=1 Tax=Paenibacillus artemisiicola TaxID=1172618 RepID=A0ABS3WJH0_9BACL|nr:SDR family oxidoreductase [Paenibacillus artemisiicola]MBO7748473.1 SDR family oxidoreductase [Paenibacillus artemisiicola]